MNNKEFKNEVVSVECKECGNKVFIGLHDQYCPVCGSELEGRSLGLQKLELNEDGSLVGGGKVFEIDFAFDEDPDCENLAV